MFCISLAAFRLSKLCPMVSVCDIDIPRYCHSSEYILAMVAWPLLSLTASWLWMRTVGPAWFLCMHDLDFNGALLCTYSAVYWPSWRDYQLFWSWLCRPHLEAILSKVFELQLSEGLYKFCPCARTLCFWFADCLLFLRLNMFNCLCNLCACATLVRGRSDHAACC